MSIALGSRINSHGRLQPRAHRFSVYRRARHRPSAVGLLLLLLLLLLTCTSSSLVALLLGGLLLVVGCSFRLLLRPLLCAALLLGTTTARRWGRLVLLLRAGRLLPAAYRVQRILLRSALQRHRRYRRAPVLLVQHACSGYRHRYHRSTASARLFLRGHGCC